MCLAIPLLIQALACPVAALPMHDSGLTITRKVSYDLSTATYTMATRGFKIPIAVTANRDRLDRFRLYVSSDEGSTWRLGGEIKPDESGFIFQAPRDGTYLFAVQTVEKNGQLLPRNLEDLEPQIKVVVRTQ